jgi:hypothetical protein
MRELLSVPVNHICYDNTRMVITEILCDMECNELAKEVETGFNSTDVLNLRILCEEICIFILK